LGQVIVTKLRDGPVPALIMKLKDLPHPHPQLQTNVFVAACAVKVVGTVYI